MFIRLFYAPWLESRVRLRAPRHVRPGTSGHVIVTEYDAVAIGLVERLRAAAIPYFIVEPDPAKAARMVGDDLSVVAGENDSRETYERLHTAAARLVVANCEDTVNTNITLTVREVAPHVPIAAVIEEEDSIDILQLSGVYIDKITSRVSGKCVSSLEVGTSSTKLAQQLAALERCAAVE